MTDIPVPEVKGGNALETCIGLSVVILATFLGVANVKDGNIVQQMQLKQAEQNDNWSWFQARKIRASVYESFADNLSIPFPNESPDAMKLREEKKAKFHELALDQLKQSKEQEDAARQAKKDYDSLNAKDDQFDLCEAALAIALALMGVTALVKRWWLFVFALLPSLFGIGMGVAGFMGIETNLPVIDWIIKILS